MTESVHVRSEILEFLHRELIGPDPSPEYRQFNNGEEILRPQDPPRLRYSAGVLFPKGIRVEQAETATDDELTDDTGEIPEGDEPDNITFGGGAGEADASTEHEVNRANEYLPSAIGLTALVRLPDTLKITVRASHYEKKSAPGLGKPGRDGKDQEHYWRKQLNLEPVELNGQIFTQADKSTREISLITGNPDLKLALHVYSRPYANAVNPQQDRIITFTLINRTVMSGNSPKDTECFFQCGFTVEGHGEKRICFLEYPERERREDDEEEQSLKLLYRHRKTFAVGHGCAAWWPESENEAVNQIRTDTLPAYEISPIMPREIPGLKLSMLQLSDINDPESIQTCRRLADEYLNWIELQDETVKGPDFPLDHRGAALRHIDICRKCHSRITDGIELLCNDPVSMQAFAWMNEAMLQQQLHYDLVANHRRRWVVKSGVMNFDSTYHEPDISNPPKGKGSWRPFQLAFILMNLASIGDRRSPDRSVVDLIWFPTGGGKTEAYLGLAAFTIFVRRLSDPNDAGTTILMRYTLRLLTTQQFQRAASLICASEIIRERYSDRIGETPISIGLWVGGDVTPNKHSNADPPGAVQAHNKLLTDGKPNPFVILTCPWCGAEMGPVTINRGAFRTPGYRMHQSRILFRCEDRDCHFSGRQGLPMHVVDEAIYEERPTLIIGTVDKFAMLPWNADARRLFGLDDETPVSPPDLIIQDELHLISGALGSMVGIYETTIDALCSHRSGEEEFPAKIVASTATICQAPQQIRSLYAREAFLFPPQGLLAGDSFFAKETDKDEEGKPVPGRFYVGVFGSALSSHVTAQIRVISALLQAVKCIPVSSQSTLDPYWTLMAYFNSLRELGHAATLIRADIREYLNAMWDRLNIRKPAAGSSDPDRRRFINRDLELTSRIQSSEITDVLQQLFNSYPGTPDCWPVDICLATNMIQVGLDVSRLGLMTVTGQPKTSSEYIQATSRVGRDKRGPGLVVNIYNTSKPRDRSHYEHFRSYHQSIYRWVEPTSVTPFAVPVRERALFSQLITLSRYWGNKNIRSTPKPPPQDELFQKIRNVIIGRIQKVDEGEIIMADDMLSELMDSWKRIQPSLYGKFGPPPEETPLIYPSGTEPRTAWSNRSKPAPTSMRNVDATCDAEVIDQFPQTGD